MAMFSIDSSSKAKAPRAPAAPAADDQGALADDPPKVDGADALPPRPEVPPALREYTRKWLAETADTPEFLAACRQYDEDLDALFPGDDGNAQRPDRPSTYRKGKKRRTRADDREVRVARIYRAAQQTLALLCPYGHTARWQETRQVPPPGGGFNAEKKDEILQQFARTLEVVDERYTREAQYEAIVRTWVLHSIWFQAGILKRSFHRQFAKDPLSRTRAVDEQEAMARLHYLLTLLMRGQIEVDSAEYQEIQSLQQGLAAGGQVEVFQGLNLSVVPLTRFKMDPRVRSVEEARSARWKEEEFPMTRAEILARWPFELDPSNPDKPWTGVHPDDLGTAMRIGSNGQVLDRERIDEVKRQERARMPAAAATSEDEEIYLVREVWATIEGKVLWLIPGLDYPADEWIPDHAPEQWDPYHIIVQNPDPRTWYGRSNTGLATEIQSRINRKMSDEEKARWLSIGGRGIYNSLLVDGETGLKLGKTQPGQFLGLPLPEGSLDDLIKWLVVPFNKEAFSTLEDDEDLRLIMALPEQAQGVTDKKTTATAIRTAVQGAAAASRDKQEVITQALTELRQAIGQTLIQEVRPEEVAADAGAYAFWPRVYDRVSAKRLMDGIHQQVHAQVLAQQEQAMVAAAIGGQPYQANEALIDQQIAQLTEQMCVAQFGLPRPLTREELYRRLQVKVTVAIDGRMDAENRITQILNLLEALGKVGLQPGQINLEPLARLIASLMNEDDEMALILKPDPNQLVMTVAQIAQTDPSRISPETAGVLAKLGILAQQYLAQEAAKAAAAQPAGGAQPPAQPQVTP